MPRSVSISSEIKVGEKYSLHVSGEHKSENFINKSSLNVLFIVEKINCFKHCLCLFLHFIYEFSLKQPCVTPAMAWPALPYPGPTQSGSDPAAH